MQRPPGCRGKRPLGCPWVGPLGGCTTRAYTFDDTGNRASLETTAHETDCDSCLVPGVMEAGPSRDGYPT